jgi:hypothetical protein
VRLTPFWKCLIRRGADEYAILRPLPSTTIII